ncbi:MAG TPA: ATP synthase subunit I [Candidatus Sulfotelmatobacter sp.]|nr:ATP synthase subunit I [Candidatus Sulfotelmatobacter sp.]
MVLENSNSGSGSGSASAQDHDFYSGAAERIPWFMVALGLAFATAAWWKFGPSTAIGFLGGSVIAFLNFQWLKSGVKGLADRVTQVGSAQSGKGIVFRFLLRYVLMGAAAYVILTSFPASLRGLFAGLFLPVGAIACEAVYETYAALIRPS